MNFYHIIEHYPPGTIYNLINGLKIYPNHKIFLIRNADDLKKLRRTIKMDDEPIIILHSTGRLLPVFSSFNNIFSNYKNKYIYMHVSYDYLIYKKRFKAIEILQKYSSMGINILSPSIAVSNQYKNNGLNTITIKPGISIKDRATRRNNSSNKKYYGKIISCCTDDSPKYKQIKGIDRLTKIIKKNHLEDKVLYVGFDNKLENEIQCKKFSNSDFIDILKNSIVYIQLSRFESYNITAIEAKQLKVPIIVSNVEGHLDSGSFGIVVSDNKAAESELLKIIERRNNQIKDIVNKNYKDSILNESIASFYKEFIKLEKGKTTSK